MSASRIVMLGAPGAGKGTQATQLAARIHGAHVSTGDMLRAAVEAGSAAAQRVGELVSSHVIPRPADGVVDAFFK